MATFIDILSLQSDMRNKMKYKITICTLLISFLFTPTAQARDDAKKFPISGPMSTETVKNLNGVKFYFGDKAPAVSKKFGTFTTRRTTNAFGKSDKQSCDWAFLSGIKTLAERARKEGGNAVINIRSITTGETVSSSTQYVCRSGNIVAKVYLEGQVVTLK